MVKGQSEEIRCSTIVVLPVFQDEEITIKVRLHFAHDRTLQQRQSSYAVFLVYILYRQLLENLILQFRPNETTASTNERVICFSWEQRSAAVPRSGRPIFLRRLRRRANGQNGTLNPRREGPSFSVKEKKAGMVRAFTKKQTLVRYQLSVQIHTCLQQSERLLFARLMAKDGQCCSGCGRYGFLEPYKYS